MEHLFVYGTLCDKDIVKKIIGRDVFFNPDILLGYKYKEDEVLSGGAAYPNIEICDESSVDGFVFDIYQEELSLFDEYEGGSYKRKRVRLESNIDAFVYISSE